MRIGICVGCTNCEYIDVFFSIKCSLFGNTNPKIYCRYFTPVSPPKQSEEITKAIEEKLKDEIMRRLSKLEERKESDSGSL